MSSHLIDSDESELIYRDQILAFRIFRVIKEEKTVGLGTVNFIR